MERCPNCKAELLFEGSEFCDHCGASLKVPAETNETPTADTDLDFVVTEAHEEQRELVGGVKPKDKPADDLGLRSSAELMEDSATENLNDTAPQRVPAYTAPEEEPATQPEPPTPEDKNRIRKLSDAELKSVEKNLYGSRTYVSEKDKRDLMKNVTPPSPAYSSEPIVPPKKAVGQAPVNPELKSDLPTPAMAKRGRGVAYFYKNYVQIQGDMELHDQDELTVNERAYVLRKKHLNSKLSLGLMIGGFAVVLLIVGSMFISSHGNGNGQIVGVVLDADQRPYIHGATVRFPDLGKSFTTNGQGFFKADDIPNGSHKIEYMVAGGQPSVDYATVSDGGTTTVTLTPSTTSGTELATTQTPVVPTPPVQPQPATNHVATVSPSPSNEGNTEAAPTTRASSRLTLAANVEGARLAIDGSVIGAGNLTYSKLKPGYHDYKVSKDGWQTQSGTVQLEPGKTTTLEVALVATEQPKVEAPQHVVSYTEGTTAMKAGDYRGAISKFTDAITKEPGYAAAYLARAEAFTADNNKKSAYDDYIRAAEIQQVGGSSSQAVAAYNKAIDLNPNEPNAYLGRANIYLTTHEEIAATADFETVLRMDDRNAQAYFGLGEARFVQGNIKEAIKQFKNAKDYDPKNAITYQYLMLCYMSTDDMKNVKKTYEKFKEIATQEEVARMASDSKFNAVMRIVQED
ncbi:MAG TPA: tetratricopeptide repeat protein [Candidatus Acidoferrum sp.]|nr:tetratricopeptide repeat protein [Candidatus Acidoferrum sp.]